MSTTAIAEPSAQLRAARNWLATSPPAIRPLAPPRTAGVTYSPARGMKTRSSPATTPGITSGKVTWKKVAIRLAPRSFEASRSAGSIRSRATNSGKIIRGR